MVRHRFGFLVVCALGVVAACLLVISSVQVAGAFPAPLAGPSPLEVSQGQPEPTLTPDPPSSPGQQSTASGASVPRRMEHFVDEEFVGEAATDFNRADSFFASGDLNGAISAYMAAEEHHGRPSAALQNMIGRVHQQYGNHNSAVSHFTDAVNISDAPVVRWNRASSLLDLRQCPAAVEDAKWLLEADDSPLPDSSTHFAAHFVMTKCHEPDLSRAGWDRVNRKPEVVFEDDDEGVVKVSPCHSAFDHWDDGMFVPCANGWRDDGNKAEFHTHTQAALKMVEDGDFSDDMVAYFHGAAWAYLSLKAVLPEPEEPEPCFNPQSPVATEITDGMRAREYLNESRRLRGLPPLRPLWGHRTVEERWDAQRAYELVSLGMLVEAACRDRRDPRYIEDLMRRMEALSGS